MNVNCLIQVKVAKLLRATLMLSRALERDARFDRDPRMFIGFSIIGGILLLTFTPHDASARCGRGGGMLAVSRLRASDGE